MKKLDVLLIGGIMNITTCNKCEKAFNIEPKRLNLGSSLKKDYFLCPFCDEEYVFAYEDRESLRLKKSIANIRNQIKSNPNDAERLMKKYRKLINKLKKHNDQLKKRM